MFGQQNQPAGNRRAHSQASTPRSPRIGRPPRHVAAGSSCDNAAAAMSSQNSKSSHSLGSDRVGFIVTMKRYSVSEGLKRILTLDPPMSLHRKSGLAQDEI